MAPARITSPTDSLELMGSGPTLSTEVLLDPVSMESSWSLCHPSSIQPRFAVFAVCVPTHSLLSVYHGELWQVGQPNSPGRVRMDPLLNSSFCLESTACCCAPHTGFPDPVFIHHCPLFPFTAQEPGNSESFRHINLAGSALELIDVSVDTV